LAPGLIALNARVRVLGPAADQELWLPLEQLYQIPRPGSEQETVLQPSQLVTHIELPAVASDANATYEVRASEGPDYPLAAAATALDWDGQTIRRSRTVLGHVAPIPWQVSQADQFLAGRQVTEETAREAGRLAVQDARPLTDNAYKIRLTQVAVKRAILRAAGLETGGF